MRPSDTAIPDDPHDQAAYWYARMRSGDASPMEIRAFELWRMADPRHALQYGRLDRLWDGSEHSGAAARPSAARIAATGASPLRLNRRRVLLGGAGLSLAVLGAGLAARPHLWQQPLHAAQLATARGERHRESLPDGAELFLNTDSRASVEIHADARRITLHAGELYLGLRADNTPAWTVAAGPAQVLMTRGRVNVRQLPEETLISVETGPVSLRSGAWWQRKTTPMETGDMIAVSASGLGHLDRVDVGPFVAWQRGRLDFRATPLWLAVDEINRYLSEPTRLDAPRLRQFPVNGAVDLNDPRGLPAALAALAPITAQVLPDGSQRLVAR